MSTQLELEPDPLSIKRLFWLMCLSIALILTISILTDRRIELKKPELAVSLRSLETKVEASSIHEVIPALAPEKPPEPISEPVVVEVVQTPPPAPEPIPEPPKPVEKPKTKPAQPVSGTQADWMAQAGIAQSDWAYVEKIIGAENHLWCPTRWNGQKHCPNVVTETNPNPRASSAYGICQALPARKMASAGADWQTNVVTQLKWCHSYAHARYGSWQNAWAEWQRKHWW